MLSAPCPDCTSPLSFEDDITVGQMNVCENCGAEVEITSVDPLMVETYEESK